MVRERAGQLSGGRYSSSRGDDGEQINSFSLLHSCESLCWARVASRLTTVGLKLSRKSCRCGWLNADTKLLSTAGSGKRQPNIAACGFAIFQPFDTSISTRWRIPDFLRWICWYDVAMW